MDRFYVIKIDPEAASDIRESKDWYNKRVPNLGDSFKKVAKAQINTLKINADIYSVRYKNVHCMLIKRFPFLVHFRIDGKSQRVEILGVIHTSRTPDIWEERTSET